jgi:hypothetical protein
MMHKFLPVVNLAQVASPAVTSAHILNPAIGDS